MKSSKVTDKQKVRKEIERRTEMINSLLVERGKLIDQFKELGGSSEMIPAVE